MADWWLTKDGDRDCLAMYLKHYSAKTYADGRKRTQFIGPGQTIVLRTLTADAVFVWRKFIDDSIDTRTGEKQQGVNCAMFRNESNIRSSDLIRQADAIADFCWPSERHYTYVNASETRMPVAFVKNKGEALIFAETMSGLSQRQKDALAALLIRDNRKVFGCAAVERVLKGEK